MSPVNKVINGKKGLVSDCNTLAYRGRREMSSGRRDIKFQNNA